ncbi:class I SAM-dependent methyltransferase [Sphingobacterium pedocola]|uniref:class I SAM-dependent methyltransferase n=1 Tax=Sphingobacterium pedocola TaxID=2082722 RepID=UPI0018CA31A8|nr:class I SAM-dependent methyltransferase [Sphingobacterium pedocola]
MNDLEKYFYNNNDKLIHKWLHYFDIYDRHFSRFRNKEITIVEIGVYQGGSLQMWKNYFGDKAKIYGIDINPNCKDLEEENIKILVGSQADRNFLRKVKQTIPPIDILIDDGGHTMLQQIITFEELFGHVKNNGVYLCEDLHTSYEVDYGGGYKRNGTFIEYSKNFIDYINAYHSEQRALKVSGFTQSVDSLHYYDSVLVVEKKERKTPTDMKTGRQSIENYLADQTSFDKLKWKIKKPALTVINKFLRSLRIKGFIWR